MYDGARVIIGLLIFLALVLFPIWFTGAAGKSGYRPELQYPVGEESCVEDTEYMRSNHMHLLDEWRHSVVRDGDRVHVSPDGTHHTKSLSGTCMSCHSSKAAFCDQCHNYVGVSPTCWDCHVEPMGE
jgi:hypothetical protein